MCLVKVCHILALQELRADKAPPPPHRHLPPPPPHAPFLSVVFWTLSTDSVLTVMLHKTCLRTHRNATFGRIRLAESCWFWRRAVLKHPSLQLPIRPHVYSFQVEQLAALVSFGRVHCSFTPSGGNYVTVGARSPQSVHSWCYWTYWTGSGE